MSSYLGSKGQSGVWQRIIGHMPVHDVFIEACLGSAQVLRRKMPSGRDIGIEVDADVVAKFRFDYPSGAEILTGSFYDVIEDLPLADMGRVVIYFDPPYHPETRTMSCGYKHDWTSADHVYFLRWVKRLLRTFPNVKVMISGYPHISYFESLSDFRAIEYRTRHHNKTVNEVLWLSFQEDVPHFHSLAGDNRRERWRIKQKAERLEARMRNMPMPERQAVFAAACRAMDPSSALPDRVCATAGSDGADAAE